MSVYYDRGGEGGGVYCCWGWEEGDGGRAGLRTR